MDLPRVCLECGAKLQSADARQEKSKSNRSKKGTTKGKTRTAKVSDEDLVRERTLNGKHHSNDDARKHSVYTSSQSKDDFLKEKMTARAARLKPVKDFPPSIHMIGKHTASTPLMRFGVHIPVPMERAYALARELAPDLPHYRIERCCFTLIDSRVIELIDESDLPSPRKNPIFAVSAITPSPDGPKFYEFYTNLRSDRGDRKFFNENIEIYLGCIREAWGLKEDELGPLMWYHDFYAYDLNTLKSDEDFEAYISHFPEGV